MPAQQHQDWLTDELEGRNDVLVADRDWLLKLYGIETGAEFSLRIISNLRTGNVLPVLIVRHENLRVLDELDCHEAIHDLRWIQFRCFGKLFPVVTIRPGAAPAEPQYGVYAGRQRQTVICTGAQLAQRIAAHDATLVSDAGCRKAVNTSAGDAFRCFTRKFLSRSLTIQDFDLLQRSGETWRPIETKRISGRAQFWAPYADDFANYMALNQAAARHGMLPPICAAYPRAARGPIAVLTVATQNGNLTGMRCMSDSVGMLTVVPATAYASDRRMAA